MFIKMDNESERVQFHNNKSVWNFTCYGTAVFELVELAALVLICVFFAAWAPSDGQKLNSRFTGQI